MKKLLFFVVFLIGIVTFVSAYSTSEEELSYQQSSVGGTNISNTSSDSTALITNPSVSPNVDENSSK